MKIYKCNNWTFNPNNQEIVYDDGVLQQLPTRISTCLVTLLEVKGETVIYDELLHKVWGTTHKDSSTISSVISELRKLIGCGKNDTKLLLTVPKKGYRFIGEVEVIVDKVAPSVVKVNETGTVTVVVDENDVVVPRQDGMFITATGDKAEKDLSKGFFSGARALLLISIGLIAVVIVTVLNLDLADPPVADNATPSMLYSGYEIMTHGAGTELDFDVSKDGQWMVYSHQDDIATKKKLYVKNLQSGDVQLLVADKQHAFEAPSFSDDLSKIAFIKNTAGACEVWMKDFSGSSIDGQSRKISNCGVAGFWSTTAFSKEGDSLFFGRSDALTEPFRIYKHDLRTGYERSITAPSSSGRGDYSFSLSPDGAKLAIIRNKLWQSTDIMIKNLNDGSLSSVVELPYLLERVAWYNNRRIIYRGENWQLYSHDINSGIRITIADLQQPLSFPVVAAQNLFVYRGLGYKSSIWQMRFDEDQKLVLDNEIRSPYVDLSPTAGASDDIYFLSNRSQNDQIWHKNGNNFAKVAGVSISALSQFKNLHYSALHHGLFGVTKNRIFRLDLNSKEFSWLTPQDIEVHNLSMSDDDSLIYSRDQNEQWFVMRLDLTTMKETDYNINGFTAHQWGDHIYFTRYRTHGLWQFDIKNRTTTKIIDDFSSYSSSYWDIFDDQLVLTKDDVMSVYSLPDGKLLQGPVILEGAVKNIQCYSAKKRCLLDLYQPGETEIIQLK
jgi:DNA-binding winged helix-turn-helix (wHTH) protein